MNKYEKSLSVSCVCAQLAYNLQLLPSFVLVDLIITGLSHFAVIPQRQHTGEHLLSMCNAVICYMLISQCILHDIM